MAFARPVPVLRRSQYRALSALTGVRQLAAGENHSCALVDNGSLWCWGRNRYDQLGIEVASGAFSNVAVRVRFPGDALSELGTIRQLATGIESCVIRDNRQVWCWGNSSAGASGLRPQQQRDLPTRVMGIEDASQLSLGFWHGCALSVAGTVRCWGRNASGQLGAGDRIDSAIARPVILEGGDVLDDIVQLSMGRRHGCALSAAGKVHCWGENGSGEVSGELRGHDFYEHAVPVKTLRRGAFRSLEGVTQISVSNSFSCALIAGVARCWGNDVASEVLASPFGDGPQRTPSFKVSTAVFTAGHRGAALRGLRELRMSSGAGCVLDETQTPWCWGGVNRMHNGYARRVENFRRNGYPRPHRLSLQWLGRRMIEDPVSKRLQAELTFAVAAWDPKSERVAVAGNGLQLQLSVRDGDVFRKNLASTPLVTVTVPVTEGRPLIAVASLTGAIPPGKVESLEILYQSVNHEKLEVGALIACRIQPDTTVWCWPNRHDPEDEEDMGNRNGNGDDDDDRGDDDDDRDDDHGHNKRGDDDDDEEEEDDDDGERDGRNRQSASGTAESTPPAASRPSISEFQRPPLGAQFQTMGLAPILRRTATGELTILSGVQQLAALQGAICMLLKDGSVWCQGWNLSFQLGAGVPFRQRSEVAEEVYFTEGPLTRIRDAVYLSALYQVCVIRRDSGVWCWGSPTFGVAGLLPEEDRKRPTQVAGIDGTAVELGLGYYNNCALTDVGTVYCWGRGNFGGLGNGGFDDSVSAVQVMLDERNPLTQIVQIDVQEYGLSCALSAAGAVYCWGDDAGELVSSRGPNRSHYNYATQLYLKDSGPRKALNGIDRIHFGVDFACGLFAETVRCWGQDGDGQLGDGAAITPKTRLSSGVVNGRGQILRGIREFDVDRGLSNGYACLIDNVGKPRCWGYELNFAVTVRDFDAQTTIAPIERATVTVVELRRRPEMIDTFDVRLRVDVMDTSGRPFDPMGWELQLAAANNLKFGSYPLHFEDGSAMVDTVLELPQTGGDVELEFEIPQLPSAARFRAEQLSLERVRTLESIRITVVGNSIRTLTHGQRIAQFSVLVTALNNRGEPIEVQALALVARLLEAGTDIRHLPSPAMPTILDIPPGTGIVQTTLTVTLGEADYHAQLELDVLWQDEDVVITTAAVRIRREVILSRMVVEAQSTTLRQGPAEDVLKAMLTVRAWGSDGKVFSLVQHGLRLGASDPIIQGDSGILPNIRFSPSVLNFDGANARSAELYISGLAGEDFHFDVGLSGVDNGVDIIPARFSVEAAEILRQITITSPDTLEQAVVGSTVNFSVTVMGYGSKGNPLAADRTLRLVAEADTGMLRILDPVLDFNGNATAVLALSLLPEPGIDSRIEFGIDNLPADVTVDSSVLLVIAHPAISTLQLTVHSASERTLSSGEEELLIEVSVAARYVARVLSETILTLEADVTGTAPRPQPLRLRLRGEEPQTVEFRLRLGSARETIVRFEPSGIGEVAVQYSGTSSVRLRLQPVLHSLELRLLTEREILLPDQKATTLSVTVRATGSDGKPFVADGLMLVGRVLSGSAGQLSSVFDTPVALKQSGGLGMYSASLGIRLGAEDFELTLELAAIAAGTAVRSTSATYTLVREIRLSTLTVHVPENLLIQTEPGQAVETTVRITAIGTDGLNFVPADGELQLLTTVLNESRSEQLTVVLSSSSLVFDARGMATARLSIVPLAGRDVVLSITVDGAGVGVGIGTEQIELIAAEILSRLSIEVPTRLEQTVVGSTVNFSVTVMGYGSKGNPLAADRTLRLVAEADTGMLRILDPVLGFNGNATAVLALSLLPEPGIDSRIEFGIDNLPADVTVDSSVLLVIAHPAISTLQLTVHSASERTLSSGEEELLIEVSVAAQYVARVLSETILTLEADVTGEAPRPQPLRIRLRGEEPQTVEFRLRLGSARETIVRFEPSGIGEAAVQYSGTSSVRLRLQPVLHSLELRLPTEREILLPDQHSTTLPVSVIATGSDGEPFAVEELMLVGRVLSGSAGQLSSVFDTPVALKQSGGLGMYSASLGIRLGAEDFELTLELAAIAAGPAVRSTSATYTLVREIRLSTLTVHVPENLLIQTEPGQAVETTVRITAIGTDGLNFVPADGELKLLATALDEPRSEQLTVILSSSSLVFDARGMATARLSIVPLAGRDVVLSITVDGAGVGVGIGTEQIELIAAEILSRLSIEVPMRLEQTVLGSTVNFSVTVMGYGSKGNPLAADRTLRLVAEADTGMLRILDPVLDFDGNATAVLALSLLPEPGIDSRIEFGIDNLPADVTVDSSVLLVIAHPAISTLQLTVHSASERTLSSGEEELLIEVSVAARYVDRVLSETILTLEADVTGAAPRPQPLRIRLRGEAPQTVEFRLRLGSARETIVRFEPSGIGEAAVQYSGTSSVRLRLQPVLHSLELRLLTEREILLPDQKATTLSVTVRATGSDGEPFVADGLMLVGRVLSGSAGQLSSVFDTPVALKQSGGLGMYSASLGIRLGAEDFELTLELAAIAAGTAVRSTSATYTLVREIRLSTLTVHVPENMLIQTEPGQAVETTVRITAIGTDGRNFVPADGELKLLATALDEPRSEQLMVVLSSSSLVFDARGMATARLSIVPLAGRDVVLSITVDGAGVGVGIGTEQIELIAAEILSRLSIEVPTRLEQSVVGSTVNFSVTVMGYGSKGNPLAADRTLRLVAEADTGMLRILDPVLDFDGNATAVLALSLLPEPGINSRIEFGIDNLPADVTVDSSVLLVIAHPAISTLQLTVHSASERTLSSGEEELLIEVSVAARYVDRVLSETILTLEADVTGEAPRPQPLRIRLRGEEPQTVEFRLRLGSARETIVRFEPSGIGEAAVQYSGTSSVRLRLQPVLHSLELRLPTEREILLPDQEATTLSVLVRATGSDGEPFVADGLMLVGRVLSGSAGQLSSVFDTPVALKQSGGLGMYSASLGIRLGAEDFELTLELAAIAAGTAVRSTSATYTLVREIRLSTLTVHVPENLLIQTEPGQAVETTVRITAIGTDGRNFVPADGELKLLATALDEPRSEQLTVILSSSSLVFDARGMATARLSIVPLAGRDVVLSITVDGAGVGVGIGTEQIELIAAEILSRLSIEVPMRLEQTVLGSTVNFSVTVMGYGSKGNPLAADRTLRLVAEADTGMLSIFNPVLAFDGNATAVLALSLLPEPGIDSRIEFGIDNLPADVTVDSNVLLVIAHPAISTLQLTVHSASERTLSSGEEELLIEVSVAARYVDRVLSETILTLEADVTGAAPRPQLLRIRLRGEEPQTVEFRLRLGSARETIVRFGPSGIGEAAVQYSGTSSVRLRLQPVLHSLELRLPTEREILLPDQEATTLSVLVRATGSDGEPFVTDGLLLVGRVLSGSAAQLLPTLDTPLALKQSGGLGMYSASLGIRMDTKDFELTLELAAIAAGLAIRSTSATYTLIREIRLSTLTVHVPENLLIQTEPGQAVETTVRITAIGTDGRNFVPADGELKLLATALDDPRSEQLTVVLSSSSLVFDARGMATARLSILPLGGRDMDLSVTVDGAGVGVDIITEQIELIAVEILSHLIIDVPMWLEQFSVGSAVKFSVTVRGQGSKGNPLTGNRTLRLAAEADTGKLKILGPVLNFDGNATAVVRLSLRPEPGMDSRIEFSIDNLPADVSVVSGVVSVIAHPVLRKLQLTVHSTAERTVISGDEELLIEVSVAAQYIGRLLSETILTLEADVTGATPQPEPVRLRLQQGESQTVGFRLRLGSARKAIVRFGASGIGSAVVKYSGISTVRLRLQPVLHSLELRLPKEREILPPDQHSTTLPVSVIATGSDGDPFAVEELMLVGRVISGRAGQLSPALDTPVALKKSGGPGMYSTSLGIRMDAEDFELTLELAAIAGGVAIRSTSVTYTLIREIDLSTLTVHVTENLLIQIEPGQAVETTVRITAVGTDGRNFVPVDGELQLLVTALEQSRSEQLEVILSPSDLGFDARGMATARLSILPLTGRDLALSITVDGAGVGVGIVTEQIDVIAVEILNRLSIEVPARLEQSVVGSTVNFSVTVRGYGSKGNPLASDRTLRLVAEANTGRLNSFYPLLDFDGNATATLALSLLLEPGIDSSIEFGIDNLPADVTVDSSVLAVIAHPVISTLQLTVHSASERTLNSADEELLIEVSVAAQYVNRVLAETIFTLEADVTGATPQPESQQVRLRGKELQTVGFRLRLGSAREAIVRFGVSGVGEAAVQYNGTSTVLLRLQPVLRRVRLQVLPQRRALDYDQSWAEFLVHVSATGSDEAPFSPSGLLLIANVSIGQAVWAPNSAQPLVLSETSMVGVATATVHIASKLPNSRLVVDIAVLETNGNSVLASTSVRVVRAPAPRLTVHAGQQLLLGKGIGAPLTTTITVFFHGSGNALFVLSQRALKFNLRELGSTQSDELLLGGGDEFSVLFANNLERPFNIKFAPEELLFDSRGVARTNLTITPLLPKQLQLTVLVTGAGEHVPIESTTLTVIASEAPPPFEFDFVTEIMQTAVGRFANFELFVRAIGSEGAPFVPAAPWTLQMHADSPVTLKRMPGITATPTTGLSFSLGTLDFDDQGVVRTRLSLRPRHGRDTTIHFSVTNERDGQSFRSSSSRLIAQPVLSTLTLSTVSGPIALQVPGENTVRVEVMISAEYLGKVPDKTVLSLIPRAAEGDLALEPIEVTILGSKPKIVSIELGRPKHRMVRLHLDIENISNHVEVVGTAAEKIELLLPVLLIPEITGLDNRQLSLVPGESAELALTIRAVDSMGFPISVDGLELHPVWSGESGIRIRAPDRIVLDSTAAVTVPIQIGVLNRRGQDRVRDTTVEITIHDGKLLALQATPASFRINIEQEVRMSDVIQMMRLLRRNSPYLSPPRNARIARILSNSQLDLDGDGSVDIHDMRIVLRYRAGLRGNVLGDNVDEEKIRALFR